MKRTQLKRKTAFKPRKSPRRASEQTKLKKRLWELCKALTRKKYGNTCYTCGREGLAGSNWHTGHYLTSSLCSVALRFDLANLRPQCYACNIHKSGNWIAFEEGIRREIGNEEITRLQNLNRETRGQLYGKDWYERKVEEYEKLLSALST